MNKLLFKVFMIIIVVCTLAVLTICWIKRENNTPVKADIEITFINRKDLAIADTKIVVMGINEKDIAYIYTTNTNGKITIKNLGERKLTFIIRTAMESYKSEYIVTENDLEQGKLIIRFDDYE